MCFLLSGDLGVRAASSRLALFSAGSPTVIGSHRRSREDSSSAGPSAYLFGMSLVKCHVSTLIYPPPLEAEAESDGRHRHWGLIFRFSR